MTTFASFMPRRTLLATLIAGFAATASAAPGDVVISQLYAHSNNAGGQWSHDFVELFNRSSSPVSLDGMSLQYQSAGGTTWNSVTRLPPVELKPGQYFLMVGRTGTQANAMPVGTGDVTSASFDMAAGGGKVALSGSITQMPAGNGTNLIDLVGFGSANHAEGAPAPVPSTVNSIQRAALGCQDTDNNRDDFAAAPVTGPRSTGSAIQACGGPVVQPIVLTCPAAVQVAQGSSSSTVLSAIDGDSIVNSASIIAGARPGISLLDFAAAGAVGGRAQAQLVIADTLAAGSYPVQIQFGNAAGDAATCSVNVNVAGELRIPAIQGSGATSPYVGTVQSTQGVITAKVGSGFFIQDAAGDGDPSTSDGLYVFGASTDAPIGELVRVTGTIIEYRPTGATRSYTEFSNVTGVQRLGTGPTVTPTNIVLPNTDLASVEAMLVRFTSPLTVNGNRNVGDRGELILANGRRENPTNRFLLGSPEALALYQEHQANQIVLDDGIFVAPAVIPYLADDGTVRVGDTVTDLTGVIDYGALGGGGAGFKLQPTMAPTFARTNERTAAPILPAGIKVGSANVLNFFTTFTDGRDAWGRTGQGCTIGNSTSAGNCRGADNTAEFIRQRDKIVKSLAALDADVVGLMEIQNNRDIAVGYLVEQLNAATAPGKYAVVPQPVALGTDAIRVAMIYKPSVVSLVGGALSDGNAVNNRAPMAQTFMASNGGGKFSVVVNHLKSKGGCSGAGAGDTDPGNGAGCWDRTRTAQAQRLTSYFIPQVIAAAGDPDVLVIGDLNAYAFESPINHLTGVAGMVNLLERFVRPNAMPYSYVFDGLSGYLDHALASSSLATQVVGAAEWHSNADEPETIDYNLNDTVQDPFRNNAYRASDHDPLVVSLNLTPAYSDVTSSVKVAVGGLAFNRVTGKYSGKITITNTGATVLSGPLHFVLPGLSEGVTLDNRSGVRNGAPYLTLPQASIAPGAVVTFTTTFTNTDRRSITYTPQLVSGAL
ncbi:ExeM/NucH family extracellular endonuclease [Oxalobacteraceae sp. CFBP 13708]|nr:ExeM/NucH family extracellular endonuclease [Oxalobacteraceae sp. CFBP 8761]MBD8722491.1 ExeM/NucH family extracellular endonuclease [Oxalobacteraceae sp. CFBP 13708]